MTVTSTAFTALSVSDVVPVAEPSTAPVIIAAGYPKIRSIESVRIESARRSKQGAPAKKVMAKAKPAAYAAIAAGLARGNDRMQSEGRKTWNQGDLEHAQFVMQELWPELN